MILHNITGGLITIGASHVPALGLDASDADKTHHAKRYEHAHEEIRILPGTSTIDPKDWAKAKRVKTVKALLEAGTLVEKAVKLATVRNTDEAIKIVKECGSTEMLADWREEEKRPLVVKAIDKQLAEIATLLAKAEAGEK